MAPIRFLHTSDLHLGKRFGRFAEETRAALQQARAGLIGRIAEAAAAGGAAHVLIGGDMFDTETPSERVQRQALAAMGAAQGLQWWIIPGNHDSGAADTLWAGLAAHAPQNVHLLLKPEPVRIAPGAVLLPAPCSHRFPGHDLTAWMDGCETGAGDIRIGLAHGAVIDFGSGKAGADTIASARSQSARLDYLALGDWHGAFTLDARSRYSGTPERDRFKHAGRGSCLLVELAGPGAPPQIEAVETGLYHWQEHVLPLTPGEDAAAGLAALLPPDRAAWHHCLLRIRAEGRAAAPGVLALQERAAALAPEFCWLELDTAALRTEHQAGDLDGIARSGALRAAAEDLLAAAQDAALTEADRSVAAAALSRLYSYVSEDSGADAAQEAAQ